MNKYEYVMAVANNERVFTDACSDYFAKCRFSELLVLARQADREIESKKRRVKNSSDIIAARREEILNLIKENPNCTKAELAEILNVSRGTIYRDFLSLRYCLRKKNNCWEIIRDLT